MKYLAKIMSTIELFIMVFIGMIAGRIAANFIINTNSSQLTVLVFTLLLGLWAFLFIRKVLRV